MPTDRPTSPHADRRVTTRQLGIRVPARMGDQLAALARKENNGVSALVRRLLTEALADHGHEGA